MSEFYPLVKNPYRNKDIAEAIKVLRSCKLTAGKVTKKISRLFFKKIKVKKFF